MFVVLVLSMVIFHVFGNSIRTLWLFIYLTFANRFIYSTQNYTIIIISYTAHIQKTKTRDVDSM